MNLAADGLAGVLDAYSYANKAPMNWLSTDTTSTEQAFVKWTELCVANADKCKIAARGNNTAEGVHKVLEDLLDVAYRNYDGTVWDIMRDSSNQTVAANPRKWSFAMIAQQIYGSLYDPRSGRLLSQMLETVIRDELSVNSTAKRLDKSASSTVPLSLNRVFPYSSLTARAENIYPSYVLSMIADAVLCGDSINSRGETTENLLQRIVEASQTVSRNFAPISIQFGIRGFCHRWTSRAVERLPKKMNIKPKNVVLVIGNSEDPITPYSSAKLLASSARLGNKARLVKYNIVGHSSSEYSAFLLTSGANIHLV
jgi:hypothetical protein